VTDVLLIAALADTAVVAAVVIGVLLDGLRNLD
jgi:hypothetical protein